jgi:ABC-type sugar transport system ATPase subunit
MSDIVFTILAIVTLGYLGLGVQPPTPDWGRMIGRTADRVPLARGTLRAVASASFEVGHGEALGLVGESGSGKAIALRALVGLPPRSASITGDRSSSTGPTSCRSTTSGAASCADGRSPWCSRSR